MQLLWNILTGVLKLPSGLEGDSPPGALVPSWHFLFLKILLVHGETLKKKKNGMSPLTETAAYMINICMTIPLSGKII